MCRPNEQVCTEERSVSQRWPLARTSFVYQQERQDKHLHFWPHIRTDTMFKLALSQPLAALFKAHCHTSQWPTVYISSRFVLGRAMAQADSHRHLTADGRVQSQSSPSGTCGQRHWDRFLSKSFGLSLSIPVHQ
jgi:hypothetical protein